MPRAWFGLAVFVAEIEELAIFVLFELGLGVGPQDSLSRERLAPDSGCEHEAKSQSREQGLGVRLSWLLIPAELLTSGAWGFGQVS